MYRVFQKKNVGEKAKVSEKKIKEEWENCQYGYSKPGASTW